MAIELAKAYVQIIPTTKGIQNTIQEEIGGEKIGTTAGLKIGNALKGALGKVAIGATIAKIFKDSLTQGSKLQQSFGGLDTIYGDAADTAKEYAYAAAQAGISANDYAEQAVSFGASLKQAFGGDTTKAVYAANTAILDMTDNAAKMGTPLESIQNAYQGFAKQNYTMLDNLKLGYGGTKTEMERLLKDAQELSGVEYDISNLGDVYEAIHVIQGELGLTGVAAQEASGTFSGSFGAMKASVANLLANMSLGEDIMPSLQSLVTNTKNFLVGNFLPMVGNVLKSVPQIIGGLFEMAAGWIKGIDWYGAGVSILTKISTGIQNLRDTIPQKIREIGQTARNWFESVDWKDVGQKAINLIRMGANILFDEIPNLLMDIGNAAFSLFEGVDWAQAGSDAINFIGTAISSLLDLVPGLLQTIGTNALNLFTSLNWISAGANLIAFITSGMAALINNIPIALKAIGSKALEWFRSIEWSDVGSKVIAFITSGMHLLVNNIPLALKSIGDAAWNTFTSINWAQAGRDIISFIGSGAQALFTYIPEKLKTIGSNALTRIKGIDWVQAGRDIITKIVNGLIDFFTKIPEKLVEIGKSAIDSFLSINWIEAGKNTITSIVDGILGKEPTVKSTTAEVAKSAQRSFTGPGWRTIGGMSAQDVALGIQSKRHNASAAGKLISDAARTSMGGGGKFVSVGEGMASGVLQGLNNMLARIRQAAATIASTALTALRNYAQIGSPSRLFRDEAGKWLALGVAEGFEDYMPVDDMVSTMQDVTGRIAGAARKSNIGELTFSGTAVPAEQTDIGYAMEAMVDTMLSGTRDIANGVEKGISKMRMVSNNRETARFVANLGFAR